VLKKKKGMYYFLGICVAFEPAILLFLLRHFCYCPKIVLKHVVTEFTSFTFLDMSRVGLP